MKIYRGGKFTDSLSTERLGCKVSQNWKQDAKKTSLTFSLDGTIDKSGARHTRFELEIEEADFIALLRAFLMADPKRLFGLIAAELEARNQEIERLHIGVRKLGRRTTDENVQQEVHNILHPQGQPSNLPLERNS